MENDGWNGNGWYFDMDPDEKERDLTIIEDVICTLKSAKRYETEMKEEIFKFVHEKLDEDRFWSSRRELLVWEKKDEFLETLWWSRDFFYYVDDELVRDKERLRELVNLPGRDNVSCQDTVYGCGDCPREGDPFDFSDELKQEAVENQGNITCPYCKESAYIFSTSCTFQNEIFNFYMTDIYLKKFNRWAEEYKKSLT